MNTTRAESAKGTDISGLEVAALVREVSGQIVGSYVSNIYSLGNSQLITFGRREEEKTLVLSPRLGAWLTKRFVEHFTTTSFTTSLRRELLRCTLESVSQFDLDRVFLFAFACSGGKKRELVLELMPPGNIIVLDERSKVIAALREVRTPQRRVLRGETYSPPAQTKLSPEQVDEDVLKSILARETRMGKALGRGISLPRRYIDEILKRSSLRQEDRPPETTEKIRKVADAVKEIVGEVMKNPRAYMAKVSDETFLMAIRPTVGEILREGATFSELLDETVDPTRFEEGRHEEVEMEGKKKEKEYQISLSRLATQLASLEETSKKLRATANLVRSAATIEEVLAAIDGVRQHVPSDSLRMIDKGESSVAAIASLLFDLAKRNETEANRVRDASASLKRRMEKEVRLVRAMRRRKDVVKPGRPRRGEWYEKFRWFFTSENKLAVGGRDAHSNSMLIKRHLERDDVVYHADLFGSPFFVLKDGGRQTDEEVREVAKATVTFSSGWKTGLGAADAYWVNSDQVSATAPSGEYLARGSFMIRGKKNFVTKSILEVSVGLDAGGRIISGPEEAIIKSAIMYLTLVPSREKASETAKKVLAELKKAAEEKTTFDCTVDDVLRALPPGGGKIVRRKETSIKRH